MRTKKRLNLPMDENLMKHVPKSAYQRIYEKSVEKYEQFNFKGDEEQFTATPAPIKRSWMPIVVSLCACAVMGIGVFAIHEINLHKIEPITDIHPQQEIIDTHTTELPLLPSMDLTQAELYFLSEQSCSDCYTISAENQAKLADYIKESSKNWELLSKDLIQGYTFRMYIMYDNIKSIVDFWSDGSICQSFPELNQAYYWHTDEEFFYQHLTNKARTIETKIPIPDGKTIHEADSVEIMNYLFQRQKNHRSTPFFNILNKDYTGSNKMIVFTNTAYAPNLFFIPDENLQSLSDAFEQGKWEEIANDSVIPDGEGVTMYVYRMNQGCFSVTFYPLNQIAVMKVQKAERTFRISEDIITALNTALDLSEEYFVENLIPCEMSEPENRFDTVWTAVDDYTETHVDLSAYQEIANRINEEYHLNMQNMALVNRENYSGEAGYFSYIIYHILLSKTPEEFEAQMRESAEAQLNYKPEVIPLDAEKIFSVTYKGYELDLTDEEKTFLCEKINQAEWNAQSSSDFVYDDLIQEFDKTEGGVLTIWTVDGDQQKSVSIALDTPDRVVKWEVSNIIGYSSLKSDATILDIVDKLNLDDVKEPQQLAEFLPISPEKITSVKFQTTPTSTKTELTLTDEQINFICESLNSAEYQYPESDNMDTQIADEFRTTKGRILTIETKEDETENLISLALDTENQAVYFCAVFGYDCMGYISFNSISGNTAFPAIIDKLNLDDTNNLEKSSFKPQVFPISPQNVTNTTFRKVTVKINRNNVEWETEDTELNLTSKKIETICNILNHAEWNAHAFDDEFYEIEQEYHRTDGRILEIQVDEPTAQKTINIALDTPSHIVEWWMENKLDSTERTGSYDTLKDDSAILAIIDELNLNNDREPAKNTDLHTPTIAPKTVKNLMLESVSVTFNGDIPASNHEVRELDYTSEQINSICEILNNANSTLMLNTSPEKHTEIQKLQAEFEQTSGQILVIETNDGIEAHIALNTPSRIVQWNVSQDDGLIQFYSILNDKNTISDILSNLPPSLPPVRYGAVNLS